MGGQRSAPGFGMESPDAFLDSLWRSATQVKHLCLIGLGAELGFWQSLLETPKTCSELAHGTSCDERRTEAWCVSMASSGITHAESFADALPWPPPPSQSGP